MADATTAGAAATTSSASQRGFGPSALATPANAVTLARLVLTPLLLVAVLAWADSWASFALWTAMAGTDGVDGYVARRQGTTRSGAFLDPLADKFLVLGAMAALVALGRFWWPPVAVIAVREVGISVWRAKVGRRGVSVPAKNLAKAKTVVQAAAVGFALLPPTADTAAAPLLLWVAVALTVVTGLQYVWPARRPARAL